MSVSPPKTSGWLVISVKWDPREGAEKGLIVKTSFAQVSDGMKITLSQRRIMRASTLKRKLVAKPQSPTNIAERMMLNGMGGEGEGARARAWEWWQRGGTTQRAVLFWLLLFSVDFAKCVFPFWYRHMIYRECTEDGDAFGKKWCSLTQHYNKDKMWKYCDWWWDFPGGAWKGLIVLMGNNLQFLLWKEEMGPPCKASPAPPRYELEVIQL